MVTTGHKSCTWVVILGSVIPENLGRFIDRGGDKLEHLEKASGWIRSLPLFI